MARRRATRDDGSGRPRDRRPKRRVARQTAKIDRLPHDGSANEEFFLRQKHVPHLSGGPLNCRIHGIYSSFTLRGIVLTLP